MRHVDRFARTLAFVLLFFTWTDAGAAEFAAPTDDGWHVWQVQGSEDGDQVSVNVRIKAGKVTKIRALTSDCPVTTSTPVNDMGVVSNGASVAWLLQHVDAGTVLAGPVQYR